MASKKLIIDTDVGTDIDDAIAIIYAVRSGYEIPLITTVHGDALQRARIAKKLTQLLEVDIPVAAGESKPIKQQQIYWGGYEGKDLVDDCERFDILHDGVEALAKTVYQHAHAIDIACLAPLTNIARAFEKYPDLPNLINNLYIMGSVDIIQTLSGPQRYLNYRPHNFKVDPEAVDSVFESPTPKTIITTDISKKNWFNRDQLSALLKTDTIGNYLARSSLAWFDRTKLDRTFLYDPLTLAHHGSPDLTQQTCHREITIAKDMRLPPPQFQDEVFALVTGKAYKAPQEAHYRGHE